MGSGLSRGAMKQFFMQRTYNKDCPRHLHQETNHSNRQKSLPILKKNTTIKPGQGESKGDAITSKANRNAYPLPAVTPHLGLLEVEYKYPGLREVYSNVRRE